ncbi:hypothetical protein TURU_068349 [Turdus rufiventris]|nr:hypothetical protein TURU_068349 [Turdus rufiventris]
MSVLFVTDLFICQICYPGSAHGRSSSPPLTLSNYPQQKDAKAGAFIIFNVNETGSEGAIVKCYRKIQNAEDSTLPVVNCSLSYTSGSTCAGNLGKMMMTLAHILLKQALKTGDPQSVLVHGVVPPLEQNLALPFVELQKGLSAHFSSLTKSS